MIALIADLADILAKPERVAHIIKKNWKKSNGSLAMLRRTELMVGEVLSLEDEDLIEESDVLITLSNKGYIKRLDQDGIYCSKAWWTWRSGEPESKMMTLSVNWFYQHP